MTTRKYLTKSIFKIGLDCPRKLFYHKKPDEYFDAKIEDPFLESLARGGYQVGMLAQLKYPMGIEISSKDYAESVAQTEQHLTEDHKVLFEAAFMGESFFVRSDIVIKNQDSLKIIEVKSKSFDGDDDSEGDLFTSSRDSKPDLPKIYGKWVPYIYDLAYQVYVARLNYPNLKITASMMLMDKSATASEDGLHQYFLVKQEGRSKQVILTKPIPDNFKDFKLLKEVDVTELVNSVIDGKETTEFHFMGSMDQKARAIADLYLNNKRFPASNAIGSLCKKCEFRGQHEGLKSGFDECWTEAANIKSASSQVLSFDLWNFRRSDEAIENKKYLLNQLEEHDLTTKNPTKTSERQMLQIELYKTQSKDPWFDKKLLKSHIESWSWPLHFIDFETCMPALPFKKDFSPYSEVAFQFSHHVMHEDGRIIHAGEYINLSQDFPSFDFVRELKRQLEKDYGTVFRYSSHENSVLNRIIFLLEHSDEADKNELIGFIKTLTVKKASAKKGDYLWNGGRLMVDLLEIVKECYLSPLMGGSNSLKFVLPAILNESSFLQKKYSNPIYGTSKMPSLNFNNYTWIKTVDGKLSADPYKELPPVFSEEELSKIENLLSEEEQIKNGGAAMMAYCKSQFTDMSDQEREGIRKALLKYCELDTLAMVMLVEYWLNVIG